MINIFRDLFFPDKCLFCQKPLAAGELDLCANCRVNAPEFKKAKKSYSFIARWTAVWYYKDTARRSILRYKFYNRRSYVRSFGRFLAMRLQKEGLDDFDLLSWVPVSPFRRWRRGYDQSELLAHAVGHELGIMPVRVLKKIRHIPPQSTIRGSAHRRANVLGAYEPVNTALVRGKRILLLDDVITTGATAAECAKTLGFAGVKQVNFAAIAASEPIKKR